MMPMPPVIAFDLDGTLVDTAPDLMACLNRLFAREGIPALDIGLAKSLIGYGIRPLIERGLAANGRSEPAPVVERMFEDYLADYSAHIADLSRPYPGVLAALDVLAARGYRAAVCTNKLERFAVQLLDALDLTSRFAFVSGADTFATRKPDAGHLVNTVLKAGGDPARAIMVGDSKTDVATARAAEIPVIGVDFGYTEIPMAELAPDRIIGHFDALPDAVEELLTVRS